MQIVWVIAVQILAMGFTAGLYFNEVNLGFPETRGAAMGQSLSMVMVGLSVALHLYSRKGKVPPILLTAMIFPAPMAQLIGLPARQLIGYLVIQFLVLLWVLRNQYRQANQGADHA